jgi:hypothetical protein
MADGPTRYGAVARGGCLFALNLGVTRLTGGLLTEAKRDLIKHDAVAVLVTRS